MLKKISIKNFKAFSDSQELTLAPITLIYGPNSSGKSSIIHALMLLKQSITRPNQQGGLVPNGDFVELGDYVSMVHGHDPTKDIEFDFLYLPAKGAAGGFSISPSFGRAQPRRYSLRYSYSKDTKSGPQEGFTFLKKLSISVKKDDKSDENLFDIGFDSSLTDNSSAPLEERVLNARTFRPLEKKYRDSVVHFLSRRGTHTSQRTKGNADKEIKLSNSIEKLLFKSDINYATPSFAFNDIDPKDDIDMQSIILMNLSIADLASELKRKFSTISYLGPLRSHPSRFYSPSNDQYESVGKHGENVPRFIYDRSPEIVDKINKWFLSFEIPYTLSVSSIGNAVTGPVICLQLQDMRTGVIVGPSDVGFGIGQILPVIVEGIVRDDGVICVEQPEIHLHPRLQAHLANFIVETKSNNQWIIETHSEALMLRLQKLIRKKMISPKDISIIYVDPTTSGGEILEIELDQDGDFKTDWPDGFFEERIKEMLER